MLDVEDSQNPSSAVAPPANKEGSDVSDTIFGQLGPQTEDLLRQRALASQKAESENMSTDEKEIMKFMDSGCGLRDKWGLRFSRDAQGGLSENYKSATRAEKAQLRLDWAKAQFTKAQRSREKAESYKYVDETCGTYKPFSMVWKGEGGPEDKGALAAATKLANRCIEMGGKWIRLNKMTDRLEFLVVEAKYREIFEKSWSLHERRTHDADGGDEPSSSAGDERVTAAKAKAETKGTPQKTNVPKRQKSSLDVALGNALQLKKSYGEAIAEANALRERVQVEGGWDWASDDMNKIAEVSKNCAKKLSPFEHRFMTSEIRAIKIEYKDKVAELELACNSFVENVTQEVVVLQKLVKKVLNMRKAADDAE